MNMDDFIEQQQNKTAQVEPPHYVYEFTKLDNTKFTTVGYLFATGSFAAVGTGGEFSALVPLSQLQSVIKVGTVPKDGHFDG